MKSKKTEKPVEKPETGPLDPVAKWLKKVKFKKAVFGVSEQDVWKKLSELNSLYETALAAERVRYDALIEDYRQACIETIRQERERHSDSGTP